MSTTTAQRGTVTRLILGVFGGGRSHDALLAILAVAIISLMVLPLPPPLLDALIAINIGLSVMLLMISMYVASPLALSTFPTLLLFTTLLRLSLNIASTRAILLHADAGDIIETFGKLVVGGNVIVGIVVFLIIAIVQFIVIAKGAERVAEVGARFTLDALPGKQMSIDAELRAGLIDRDESRRKRDQLQRESQLYGAMDGAMKFVKGDAIAGLLIALVNILAGVSIGVAMHSMAFGEAVDTYSILTVGDGLVSQIPSLFVSLAAGVLITRVSSGEAVAGRPGSAAGLGLGSEIAQQITAQPKALLVTAAVLALFMLVPGFPKMQFLFWALVLGGGGVFFTRLQKRRAVFDPMGARNIHRDGIARQRTASDIDQELITSYAVALQVAPSLLPLLEGGRLDDEIGRVRRKITHQLGVPFPGVAIVVNEALQHNHASVLVNEIPTGASLELPGDDVAKIGATLEAVLAKHAFEFVGLQEAKHLLSESEKAFPDLVAEAARLVPLTRLTDVLRRLVEEGIAVRNMRDILQALIEWSPKEKDPVLLTEYVRMALARQITHQFGGAEKTLRAVTLGRAVEDLVRGEIKATPAGNYLSLEPKQGEALAKKIDALIKGAPIEPLSLSAPVVVMSMDVRRYVKKLIESHGCHAPALSYQELASDARIQGIGQVHSIT